MVFSITSTFGFHALNYKMINRAGLTRRCASKIMTEMARPCNLEMQHSCPCPAYISMAARIGPKTTPTHTDAAASDGH